MGSWSTVRPFALPVLITVATVWSVLAVGGAGLVPCFVTALLAALVAAVASLDARSERAASIFPIAAVWMLVLYSLLQTVPLPAGIVAQLSPAGADIWSRSGIPIHRSLTSFPVSLDPGATTFEAAKYASYAAIFFGAAVMARNRGVATGTTIVFAAGVTLAVATIGHELAGARTLFGIYEPRNTFGRIAPLLNANNLAGYLNLATLAGLGLLHSPKTRIPRAFMVAGVALCMAVSFRAASRAGVVSLLLGLIVAGALSFLARKRESTVGRERAMTVWPLLAAGGFALGLALVTGEEAFWKDLLNQSILKLDLVRASTAVASDFPAVGIGRGAFESVYLAYRPEQGIHIAFTHPENIVVQWVAEWGFAVGLAGLCALAFLFRPTNVGAVRSQLNAYVFAGALALVVHNLLDLSLELPGPAVALAVLAGSLWGDVRRRRPARQQWAVVRPRHGWFSAALVLVCLALYAVRGYSPLETERERLASALRSIETADDRLRFQAELSEAVLRHPADYYFPLLGAIAATKFGDDPPIPWLQRALERGPTIGRTHVVLAEVLGRNGAVGQCMLELKIALGHEPSLVQLVAQTALRHSRDFAELQQAAPAGPTGGLLLDEMARQVGESDSALRESLDAAAIGLAPRLRGPHERSAATLIRALNAETDRCLDRPRCLAELIGHGEALRDADARSSFGSQLIAHAYLLAGDRRGAQEVLEVACKLPNDELSCLQLSMAVVSDDDLEDVVDRYTGRACTTKISCLEAWEFVGRNYAGRSLWSLAYGSAKRAAQLEPSTGRWTTAADYAERGKQYALAIEALQNAKALRPDTEGVDARIASLRARMQ